MCILNNWGYLITFLFFQVRAIGAGEIEPPPIFIADDIAEELGEYDDEEDDDDDGGIIAVDLDMFGGGEEEEGRGEEVGCA